MKSGYRVFISYRRADQPALAQWLHDRLAGELHADEVFLDYEGLEVGRYYEFVVQSRSEARDLVLSL